MITAWGLTAMINGLAPGQESTVVEDMTLPVPPTTDSFDVGDADMPSVLVDDRQDGPSRGELVSNEAFRNETFEGGSDTGFDPGWDPAAVAWDGGCRDHCCEGRRWAIQADALVLWRNNIAGQPLLLDNVGAFALDPADVRTAAAAGPRIGVIRSLGCGRAIEGNWFNVGGIQGTTVTDGLGAPYTVIGLADLPFRDIVSAGFTTRGQIKSAEFNYRWSQGRRVIWLAGFRWIEWNETATVNYEFENPEPFGNGSIQSRVGNDLYGGQFGCRLRLWDLGKWQVSTVGKAGVYGNNVFQRTSVNGGLPPQPTIGAVADDVAFFGEVGVNSTLWITRWLAWRAGYNFFWLEGVATAAQQLPLGSFGTGTASINTNGSVFLQGFSTGLEARW